MQDRPQAAGHFYGMAAQVEIQPVGKEGVELDPVQPAFGQQGTALFDLGEEMLGRVVARKDDRFAAQGSHLGPADIEYIGKGGYVRERQVASFRRQAVGEPGSVKIERNIVAVAHFVNRFEFLSGIEGPVFGGEGKVHHAREDHVFVVGIVEEGFQQSFNFAGEHFPVVAGNGQNLVAGMLDGPGFMDGNVARLCGDNTLPALQEAADDGLVGLGAACQEEHAGIGTAARAERVYSSDP